MIFAEYNPRKLSDKACKHLEDSIKKFGIVDPIIINVNTDRKNIIIGGHQRVRVAKKIGIDIVPCIELNLSVEKEKELNIRLNKNTGEWDWDILDDLFEMDDLIDYGFAEEDFPELEEEKITGNTDPDEVPEVFESICKLGNLWLLGRHRLLCGDATEVKNVELLMNGNKAAMVFTDPPYEMSVDDIYKAVNKFNDIVMLCTFSQAIKLCNVFNFHFDFVFIANIPKSFMNKKQPYYLHQTGIYLTSDNKSRFNCDNAKGVRSENGYWSTVINAPRDITNHGHGKSVEAIINVLSGWRNKEIIDPFLGSGSTIIACEQTNCKCYGMEIDPHNCDVIIKRWENFTNRKAKLIE